MVKQGSEDETAVMKKQLGEATLSRSTTEEELHGAEAALTQEGKQLAADQTFLAELKQSCSAKASANLEGLARGSSHRASRESGIDPYQAGREGQGAGAEASECARSL